MSGDEEVLVLPGDRWPFLVRTVPAGQDGDLAGVAKVHLATRRDAYAHLLPAAALASMTEAGLRAWWTQRVSAASAPHQLQVAVHRDSPAQVLGFAHVGPSEHQLGELYALHVHPAVQGRHVGALLLAAAADSLRDVGYRRARLWVLEGNLKAQGFYRRHGWCPVEGLRRVEEIEGVPVPEVAYERDLAAFARSARDPDGDGARPSVSS